MNFGKNQNPSILIAVILFPLVPEEHLVVQNATAITQKNPQCTRSVIHVDGSKDIKTNIMTEYDYGDFVKPEVAIELRSLGFNLECDYFYINVNGKHSNYPTKWYKFAENWNRFVNRVSCPTYSEAFRWFLKNKQLFASIRMTSLGIFFYEIWMSKTANDWRMIAFSNAMEFVEIEKIEEDCLKRLIILANKNDL